MLRKAASIPLSLAVVLAASGWLYLARGSVGTHPLVAEALPLDELARHSAAPLLLFVAVWGVAALFLGAIARWARVERLVAAIMLALAVGLWQYAAATVSIAAVRQVSAQVALDAASRLSAVYLPAALAAGAGALIALPRRRRHRAPLLVATLVAVAGGLELAHAMLPGDNGGLVRVLTPDAVGPLARAAAAVVGIALLVASRGLARRRSRAWRVAIACAALSSALHVLHGLNDGTLASTFVLVLLVARRHDFDGPGDVETRHLAARRAAIVIVILACYGTATLWLNRMVADQTLTVRFVAHEVVGGVFGLNVAGSPHLAGAFGDWYPLSLLLLAVAGTSWVLAGWLAPWRHRALQDARERELAHELVRLWGSDTLAPFALRRDKAYFFTADRRAFLAYRVVHGVAIVSGDPIGPPELLSVLVASFVRHARERAWRVAVLGVSESHLELYRRHGLHALYHGDEAIVDTAAFSVEGRAIRKVRQSVHRLQHAGYTAAVLAPSELGPDVRAELEAIMRDWRGDAPERGFVMALDALFSLGDDDAVFAIGLDPSGRPTGFLHFAVSHVGGSLSLSSMPRLASTPNGFNEWLIVETIDWARTNGYGRVSLNFAPFAALLAPEAELTPMQGVQRRALLALKGHFQLDNLLLFNRKFFPEWERRFVVYERRRDLPRVGIAALSAEAYLPFGGGRR
jgi:lysyl-tRNA synthetase class 2